MYNKQLFKTLNLIRCFITIQFRKVLLSLIRRKYIYIAGNPTMKSLASRIQRIHNALLYKWFRNEYTNSDRVVMMMYVCRRFYDIHPWSIYQKLEIQNSSCHAQLS